MPSLDQRLHLAAGLSPVLAGAALVQTLPHASVPERKRILRILLDLALAHPESGVVKAMLRFWRFVDVQTRAALVALAAPDLPDLLRVLMESADPADHAGARHLALDAARFAFGPAPDDRIEPVRDQLRRVMVDEPGDTCLAAAATRIEELRSGDSLEAIVWIAARAGPRLRTWLRDEGQAGHMPLRAAARSMDRSRTRQHAISWLASPALRATGAQIIQRDFEDRSGLATHLASAHLLRARDRARALSRLGRDADTVDALLDSKALAPAARRGRIGWIQSLPLTDVQRVDTLARSWMDSSVGVRLDSALALARHAPSKASDDALCDFAFDSAEMVARAAVASIVDSRTPARRMHHLPLYEKLERSSHPSVRAIARSAQRWSDPLDCTLSLASARLALSQDPDGFVSRLRQQIGQADSGAALAPLDLAARLDLIDRIDDLLIERAQGEDHKLASKAVLLLGKARGERATLVVTAALDHPNGRVRASAIEALARQQPRSPRFDLFFDDQVPRVRANAIHHRVRTQEVIDDLATMLTDSRPGHRLSALWVARRRREVRLASRIAEISSQDPAPIVRTSARRCARDLLAAMRHGWSESTVRATIVTRPLGDRPRRAG